VVKILVSTFGVVAIAIAIGIGIGIGIGVDWTKSDSRTRRAWQLAVVPGALSQPHAFLSNNCAACHSPIRGVEPTLCITCHADNKALLQRQPTAFHATAQVCSGCHVEHQGTLRMPTKMDHALLAELGHRQAVAATPSPRLTGTERVDDASARRPRNKLPAPALDALSPEVAQPSASVVPLDPQHRDGNESMLDCTSCHATKDRHQGLFGADCMQCHATTQWTVAEFVHPSVRSTDCAQCHLPPPSHNMMHFSMMSAPIARQVNAKVHQCFLCHQTTHWNDIQDVGRVKHH
jgi:hypothetical protein